MGVAGDDKILVCEFNRVVEYDLKTGNESWSHKVTNPSSVQRLPNGNTVIAGVYVGNSGRVIEVDTAGEVVWEYESKDGMRPQRAVRRELPGGVGPKSGGGSCGAGPRGGVGRSGIGSAGGRGDGAASPPLFARLGKQLSKNPATGALLQPITHASAAMRIMRFMPQL